MASIENKNTNPTHLPFRASFREQKIQLMYKIPELLEQGLLDGDIIDAITIPIRERNSKHPYSAVNINLYYATNGVDSYVNFVNLGYPEVLPPAPTNLLAPNAPGAPGKIINVFSGEISFLSIPARDSGNVTVSLTTPFIFSTNGENNYPLIVEICYSQNPTSANDQTWQTQTIGFRSVLQLANLGAYAVAACAFNNQAPSGIKLTQRFSSDLRPRLIFKTQPELIKRINECKKNKNTKLNLSQCELKEIPKEISDFHWLEELNLSYNQISKIDGLQKLTNLSKLNLSYNQISKIEGLEKLNNISVLSLSSNQIGKIEGLEKLNNISKLYLHKNQISKIEGLEKLNNIFVLDLAYNQISKIEGLEKLNNISALFLHNNQISKIERLEKLNNIFELYLDNNQIGKIEGLEKLNNISELCLSDNKISKIEGLEKLNNISAVYLNNNQIRKIEGLHNLISLTVIDLDDNPIENCPADIWQSKDARQIRAYFEEENKLKKVKPAPTVSLAVVPVRDVKLILLGNSNAGKTNLVHYLKTGKFLNKRDSTHGLKVIRWKPTVKLFPLLKNTQVSIWDFGGQEYYHEAYKLFLSANAVYVVVWDKEGNVNKNIPASLKDGEAQVPLERFEKRYWLDTVRHYGSKNDDTPLLLVQNKTDNRQLDRQRVEQSLHDRYGITESFHISLKEGCSALDRQQRQALEYFTSELESQLDAACDKVAPIENWLKVRETILSATGKKNIFNKYIKERAYIDLKDFEKACNELCNGELSANELYTLPRWLDKGGVLVYFDKNDNLNNKVFISPQVLSKKIYRILNKTVLEKKGEFGKEDIPFTISFKETFISVTKDLGLIYDHPLYAGKFIAPQYLPAEHAIEDLFKIASVNAWKDEFRIKVPLFYYKKLLNHLVMYYIEDEKTTARYFWKHGIVFIKNNLRVLIKGLYPKEDEHEGIILLAVENEAGKKEMQKELFSVVYLLGAQIGDEWDMVEDKNRIALKGRKQDMITISNPEPKEKTFFTSGWRGILNKLLDIGIKALADVISSLIKAPFFENLEISYDGKNYVPFTLLQSVGEDETQIPGIKTKLYLKHFEPALVHDKTMQKPKKIFVSYSHQNTQWLNKIKIHLSGLRHNQIIEDWDDQLLIATDQWDKKIKEKMEEADVFICLLSADFVASEYIWNVELKEVFTHLKTKGAKVIFLYVEPFDLGSIKNAIISEDLKDTKILDFEIKPKDSMGQLKAASLWENENEALAEIAKQVRLAVEE